MFPYQQLGIELGQHFEYNRNMLPIYSKTPCACNQHAEQSCDDFVSPLPARYIAIVYQVIL